MDSNRLYQLQEAVGQRVDEIVSNAPGWPCRKGCDECCRHLASVPRISRDEWELIASALYGLPFQTAEAVRRRIVESASAVRPVVCPLLDTESGSCLVYAARPVICRAYGFYAERHAVLGCPRIEAIWRESADVVWGNHEILETQLSSLGETAELPIGLPKSDETSIEP